MKSGKENMVTFLFTHNHDYDSHINFILVVFSLVDSVNYFLPHVPTTEPF